jgi:hypothetical protein
MCVLTGLVQAQPARHQPHDAIRVTVGGCQTAERCDRGHGYRRRRLHLIVRRDSAAVPFFRYLNRSCLDAAVAFGRANSLRGSTPRRWLHAILDSAALRTAGALDHCGIDCATKVRLALDHSPREALTNGGTALAPSPVVGFAALNYGGRSKPAASRSRRSSWRR